MADDIRLKVGLFSHYKTKRLIKRLGFEAGFKLLHLFAWAATNRPDGDLSGMTSEDIEAAVDWSGDIGTFTACLSEIGFIDGPDRGYSIHDWHEHNPWAAGSQDRSESARWAALCRRYGRAKAAEQMPDYADRMRAAREAQAGSQNAQCPVSDTSPVSDSDSDSDFVSVSVSDTVSNTDTPPKGETVAPPLSLAPPAGTPGKKVKPASKTGQVWAAYASAFVDRYGVEPSRNAKSSSLLGQLVDRIGQDEAGEVAAFYVRHNSAYYVRRGHSLQCLIADAESLRMQWATNRQITQSEANGADRTHGRMAGFDRLLIRDGEGKVV
jgi:hypothetical protein